MKKTETTTDHILQIIGKAAECLLLSILWVICSVPVISSGAASAALYYSINKVVRSGNGYIWNEFWSSVKSNFKQSIILWLIGLVLVFFLTVDCYVMWKLMVIESAVIWFLISFALILVLVMMWMQYWFPYVARFHDPLKQILKNTFLICVCHPLRSFLLLLLFIISTAGAVILILAFEPWYALLIPILYMLPTHFLIEQVFRKYTRKEDLAEPEDA